jgi:hypothetical protein
MNGKKPKGLVFTFLKKKNLPLTDKILQPVGYVIFTLCVGATNSIANSGNTLELP